MSAPIPTTIRTRAVRSLTPAVLARSAALAILAVIAAPVFAMVVVLLFGLAAGAALATTPTGALAQSIGINVILYGSAVLAVLVGVLVIAQLHSDAYAYEKRPLRRALAGALATLPRLLGALALLVIVVLVTLLAWAPVTGAALVLAVVLHVRYRRGAPEVHVGRSRTSPGVRRALLWAIPFLPLLAALAALIALFPASLARPCTVRSLLRSAIDGVCHQKRSLLRLVLVVAPVSAVLTWGGSTVSSGVQAGATEPTSAGFIGGTLVLAFALAVLLIFSGAAIAVLSPPSLPGRTDAAVSAGRVGLRSRYADFLRRATPAMRRTAMVTVLALCSTFVATPAFATTTTTPTTMAVYELNQSRVGSDMTFHVYMTSNGNPVTVTGTVEVYSGATLVTTVNTDNLTWVVVPTDGLSPGTVPLRFVYIPTGQFEPSEDSISVDLGKAMTSLYIMATPSWNESITWGESHSIEASVTGELDGPRTLIVRDGTSRDSPIAASADFTVTNGAATLTLDLTKKLGFGTHTYRAEVVGTDTSNAAGTDEYMINVDRAPTTVALTATPATVGSPVTLTATASSSATNAGVVAGQMKFYVNGNDLGAVAVDVNGQASIRYTPTTVVDFVVRADYSQVAAPYTHLWSSSGDVTAAVIPANAPWPSSRWYGDLTVEDSWLELSYTAAAGLPAPSGWVQIVDSRYVPVGRGYLVDGALKMKIAAVSGQIYYYAQYEGDALYLARQTYLPDLVVASYIPALAVTLPTEPRIGTTLSVGVTLADVPVGLVESVTVYDSVYGGRSSLGTIALNDAGTGSLDWSTLVAGEHPIVVEVTYTTVSGLAPTVSDTLTATVLPAEVPDLRITTDTPTGSLRAGAPVHLVVTAHTLASGTPGLAAGTAAVIVDAAGRGLGTVTLVAGANGLVGSLTVSTLRGGLAQLHARAIYGPLDQTVNGAAFDLTLAAPTTYLSVSAAPVTAGGLATVTVTAAVPFGLPGESTRIVATVTVDDVDYPVNLWRSNGTDAFTGAVDVPTASAGWLAMTATMTGDGIDTGPATVSTTFYVGKRSTYVYVMPIHNAIVSESLTVTPVMGSVTSSVLNAGTVSVTLSPSGAICVAAPNAPCTFPAWAVRAGENVAVAQYSGDDQYLPAESSNVSFEAAARYSILTTSYDPLPAHWIEGEPVTVSWAVTTSGAPAAGLVEATIGANRCAGPALAGSCVIVVPNRVWGTTDTYQPYSTVFAPFDDAPAQRQDGRVITRACVTAVASHASLDLSEATACQRGSMQGILTGSIVTITADAPAPNFVRTGWWFEGAQWARGSHGDATISVRLQGVMRAWPLTQYYPQCFTLTLNPNTTTAYDPGRLVSFTKPNCASPDGATETELREKEAGAPRYAAGTVVELYAIHNTENRGATSWERPALDLLSFDGAQREAANPAFAHVVMDQDRTVTAKFKVRDCISISMVSGKGGTVVVQSSSRPDTTAHFTPYSGACTDASGTAGYVPGTQLTLKATAATGTFLAAFSEADNNCSWEVSGACKFFDPAFKIRAVASKTTPPVSLTQQVTVVKPARYGAIFAEVRCVAITSIASSPIGTSYSLDTRTGTPVNVSNLDHDRETGCGGIASRSSQEAVGAYSIHSTTDSVLATGTLTFGTTYTQISYGRNGSSHVTWSTSNRGAVATAGVDRSGTGPTIDLTKVVGALTINANWYSDSCRVPVALPQGGGVTIVSDTAEPFCMPGQWSEWQSGYLDAQFSLNAPNLMPFFSVETHDGQDSRLQPAPDGRSYIRMQLDVPDVHTLRFYSPRLEYCAELGLSASVQDDSGASSWMPLGTMNKIVADDGGCPPGWARPGRTVGIGLTSTGNYTYSQLNGGASTGASVTLNSQGDITRRVGLPLALKQVCHTVSVGENVSLTTVANCPGGASNRYLRGTVVQVQFSPTESGDFLKWTNVAQSKGTTAWVIASEDRSPSVDIARISNEEMAFNVVSNLAQRGLTYLVTFATGVLMAELVVVQGIALALQGVSTGLHALGVEGKVLDGFDEGVAIITSQIAMVSMLSTCMQSWSSGAGIAELPIDDELVADGADMATGAITDQISDRLESALKNSGRSGAASMMGVIGQGQDMANIFGSNLNMLTRGAAVGWNSIADDVGGCMVKGMETAGWR
ncbi:Ig-like domain-containing protein [Cryobacterium ruanii]|uniref:Ig-like domain repeat protein n=1 Tax=Cryobacterium ruanii TaxID=1259197 RepID=A0A4R9AK46_9MICO|nr:Ig-like domain-containing protein [Cryobacterium ruanii]TFD63566.1 Ig-like domain repeat protein [Cryobacterium ruanii]